MSTIPTDIRTLVVKIGTTLLTGPEGLNTGLLERVVKDIAELKHTRGTNVLIVSSGAVGCGMEILGMKQRPKSLPAKQATAAVGQSRLMHYYENLLRTEGSDLKAAQILLSASDLDNRQTYLNIRNATKALFEMPGVIPIVNENDPLATEELELRFGDNDTLAAKLAAKIDADVLIILTDVDGLYDSNPLTHADARLLGHVDRVTPEIEALAGGTAVETSVGGMATKLKAARIACAAGVMAVLANGRREHVIRDVLAGRGPMTVFGRSEEALRHRKRWIAFGRSARGQVVVDEGARRALTEQGRSLLAAGIVDVQGHFGVGSAVRVKDMAGNDIGRGLVNYSSEDIARIKGRKSGEIAGILGRADFEEVIHRNNLVVGV